MDLLYKEFGRLLRKARKNAALTQGEVAERVGLSRTSITNIEKGRQHFLLHHLFLLASAVGVHPTELLPQGEAALEELLPARALRALPDEQSRDFAARVLSRRSEDPIDRKAAS
jgi:transcriptional regulator with XRE-family HTH domain